MTRILIGGSTDYNDWQAVYRAIEKTCKEWGVWGESVNAASRDAVIVYPPEGALGTAVKNFVQELKGTAEPHAVGEGTVDERNQLMVDLEADVCLDFSVDGSITLDIASRAEAADIPVVYYTYE